MPSGLCKLNDFKNRNYAEKTRTQIKRQPNMNVMRFRYFWITLLDVEALDSISICLKSGLDIICRCSIYKLLWAENTYEDNLLQYMNQELIIYVHNVKNNMLEVSFFDNFGTKIELLSGDMREHVELPLNHPVIHEDVYGFVTSNETEWLYIFPSGQQEAYRLFTEEMGMHYELAQVPNISVSPTPEAIYVIRDSTDLTKWHRVKVTYESGFDKRVEIESVDTGKLEMVDWKLLYPLHPQFLRMPKFCIQVDGRYVDSKTLPVGTDVILRGIRSVGTNELEGTTIEGRSGSLSDSISLERPDRPIEINDFYKATFFITYKEDVWLEREIYKKLTSIADSLPDVQCMNVGIHGAAYWRHNKTYLRTVIESFVGSRARVFYYDYGTYRVLEEGEKLKEIPPEILALPKCAKGVQLRIETLNGWRDVIQETFVKSCKSEDVTMKIIEEKPIYCEVPLVDIYDTGSSITELLVGKGLAFEMVPVRVKRVVSPNEFYLEKTDDEGIIKEFGRTADRDDWDDYVSSSGPRERTIRSSLRLLPKEEHWSSEAIQIICDQELGVNVQAVIMESQNRKTKFVKLYSDGKDVSQELLNRRLAIVDTSEPYVEPPRDFISPPISNCTVPLDEEEW